MSVIGFLNQLTVSSSILAFFPVFKEANKIGHKLCEAMWRRKLQLKVRLPVSTSKYIAHVNLIGPAGELERDPTIRLCFDLTLGAAAVIVEIDASPHLLVGIAINHKHLLELRPLARIYA